jgi:hypothetical protein
MDNYEGKQTMKRFKSMFMAALAVLIAAGYIMPALPAAAAGSASLSIVPKKNYTIEPGKSVKDKLTIRNLDNDQPLNLTLRVVDFTYTDDGGTPKLMLAADAPQTTWSLKPYLKIPDTVSIPAKASKTIDMSVAVPAKGGAGSYYSAIVYSTGASDGANVGLSASGVTLVFASIPGTVKEDLTLQKFGAYGAAKADKKADYVSVTSDEPRIIAYTLKNNGNVTESPVGSITLKDMFGKERTIDDVNPNGSLALIGQTRTYTACIAIKAQSIDFNGTRSEAKECDAAGLWPGLYHVSLSLYYGQNGNNTQEISGTTTFWYLPWWFVIAFLIVLAIAAYFIWRIVRFVRAKLNGPNLKKVSRRK